MALHTVAMPRPCRSMGRWSRRPLVGGLVGALVLTASIAVPTSAASSSALAVPAGRQPLATNGRSSVAHDTETEALVAHSGRLFAATGQWEYPGPIGFRTDPGQEVKDQSVDGLRADAVPSGPGAGLLPDPERSGSRAGPFPSRHPSHRRRTFEDPVVARRRHVLFALAIRTFSRQAPTSVRSAHTSRAGSGPSTPGSARRGFSRESGHRARHTLVFSPKPELTVAPPGSPGAVTQKVTGFADCAGALYYDHQHDALSAQRRRPALRCPSLGPGVPSATGRAAQQRAPGYHVPHP